MNTDCNPLSVGSHKGRKGDPVREYFENDGAYVAKQKRYPMRCTLCNTSLPVAQTTAAGLKRHLQACSMATPEIRALVMQAQAGKINQQAAAAAAAAAGSSLSRKRSSFGSSSQGGFQMSMEHYAAGSKPNILLPGERDSANQHLLRALVCGGIPFKVGRRGGWRLSQFSQHAVAAEGAGAGAPLCHVAATAAAAAHRPRTLCRCFPSKQCACCQPTRASSL